MARILVVEDDSVTSAFLEDLIVKHASERYESDYCLRFTHVKSAIDALKILDIHAFELIITDIMMAKMDGWEFIKEVRKDFTRSDLPILVVSAIDSADMNFEAVSRGATDGFAKPLKGDEMKRFLKVVFNLIIER